MSLFPLSSVCLDPSFSILYALVKFCSGLLRSRLADTSRLQSFKRDVGQNLQGDTKRVEIIIRPPPSGRKEEKKVEVLEGQLVSTVA
jgi:hypothetical protein